MTSLEILIGTGNRGKVTEIKRVLKNLPLKLHVITDFPGIRPPVECGGSYAENAIIKAQSYAGQTGLWTLADDSGLEVASLNGLPGLRSARFGGEGLADAGRTNLLLSELLAVGDDERSARFICAVVIAKPTGEVINVAHGLCQGNITNAPSGHEGFGYDPVFMPTGYKMTFAAMPFLLKNTISHRGKALAATREFLERFFVDAS
ncbi:MAG: non-canonical purine NTP pyrophosphatase [Acidobacteriota bacterium]|nr:non-canonical purine NTP pyrophosphatase [Acidobacteriota bacterium]